MKTRQEVAELIKQSAFGHKEEYVRCVLFSVSFACKHGTVEGHFKGNEDLTIQQIRDRLLVAARDERLAREDCAYSMVDRLTAASDALVTIVEQLNEV